MTDLTPEQRQAIFQIQQDYAVTVERAKQDYSRALMAADEDRIKRLARVGVNPAMLPVPATTLEQAVALALQYTSADYHERQARGKCGG